MLSSFAFSRVPRIVFGEGERNRLDRLIREFGDTALIVTGGAFLERTGRYDELVRNLEKESISHSHVRAAGEPSPDFVDEVASEYRSRGCEVVVAVGGGSAVDCGKAISAMLPQDTSVYDYLEGIGGKTHDGRKTPFIAAPTTSGTGSEATKNAVLSKVGPGGFKKSIRHDNLVPDIALIDPEFMVSSSSEISAACGMDAFSQLLESYVSTKASPLTDALAYSGIAHLKESLIPVCTTDPHNVRMRAAMAYASLLSGITLANAGLGVVHGLASPIGGFFPIPHGVVCGTLLGAQTRVNIEVLRSRGSADNVALRKYGKVVALIAGRDYDEADVDHCCDLLVETIDRWTEMLNIPRLSHFGLGTADLDKIAEHADNKNNPVELNPQEIKELLSMRL
jgi:alcohol dehydrogenase class IV